MVRCRTVPGQASTEPRGVRSDRADPRQRLLEGLAASIREKGYRESTVADIVRHARTSRRTFYEHFSSRQECFVVLLEQVNELLVRHIDASVDRTAAWRVQVRQAISAWLEGAQLEPALTMAWAWDARALGEAAGGLHHRAQQAFVDLVQELARGPALDREGLQPPSPEMAVVLVGGLGELIANQVARGADLADLTEVAVAAATALLAA